MLFSFWLAREAPGDPFKIASVQSIRPGSESLSSKKEGEEKPLFYFSISPLDRAHPIQQYIPMLSWNGSNNQLSIWTGRLLTGDFGNSIRYRINVWKVVKKPFLISLAIGTLSTLILIAISIWLAKYLATNSTKGSNEKIWSFLDLIYAIPSYWLAVLLLTFLASSTFLNLFPSGGIGMNKGNFLLNMLDFLYHIFLPVICISLPPIAYYTKIIFQNIEQESHKVYALSAAARGFSSKYILDKELLRNSLIPLVTHLSLFISAILGGALIIEKIFNLPGLGKLMVESYSFRDYPVIFCIAFITGLFTLVGYLATDLIIIRLSPTIRESFEKENA